MNIFKNQAIKQQRTKSRKEEEQIDLLINK